MARHHNTEERFAVMVTAIISLDIANLKGTRMNQALNGRTAPELCSRLLAKIDEDTNFAVFANTPVVRQALDWERIRALAFEGRKATLTFPQPVLSGADLYNRNEVLGPRYHGNAVKVLKGIVAFLRDGVGAGPGARIPRVLSLETRLALYHFAAKYPGLRSRLAQDLSPAVYSEEDVRTGYESRRREEMGLFAATLTA